MTDAGVIERQAQKIGYARVSTKDQRLDLQIRALKEAGCDKVFRDKGVSGKSFKRKGLDAAIKVLERGDTLIVYKLDRLGRSLLQLERLRHRLERRGVELQSLSQSADTSTASGKLVFQIFAAFAEFESNLNSERTIGGMKARKANGIHLGRRHKLSLEDAAAIQRMLASPDINVATVASIYEVSPNTIMRTLSRLEETVS